MNAKVAAGLASWELLIQRSRHSTAYIDRTERQRAAARSAQEPPPPTKKAAGVRGS